MMTLRMHDTFADFEREYPEAEMFFPLHEGQAQLRGGFLSRRMLPRVRQRDEGPGRIAPAARYDRCVRIPMIEGARSLNLSNSVAIVAYEALRQQNFAGLQEKGALHHTPLGEEWRDYI
jgi:tRNA (cytidine/uridine-2'-O-)-methyltransferase